MKQLKFFSSLAIASMLFATSCSQEEIVNEVANGDYVDATFTLTAADGIASRAIGDGSQVDKVACTIYDANGVEMDLYAIRPFENGTATYQVRLAKGQDYRAAFFAFKSNANGESDYYTIDNLANIKIKSNQLSNLEDRDAFTNNQPINATDLTNKDNVELNVTLRRPFAQLNLGIDNDEYVAAKKAGIEVAHSKITVTNVYDAFNAYTNTVVAGNPVASMTFDMNDVPAEDLVIGNDTYKYIALNYLLVGDLQQEKSLTDVDLVWETVDGKTNNPTTHFINIPVQRNYRTNIIGKLLTTPTEFYITITPDFETPDGYIERVENNITKTVTTAEELQAAIDACAVGMTTIKLGNDITATNLIEVKQAKDVQIYIDGQNYTLDGQIYIDGQNNWNGTEALTLHNIQFTYTGTDHNDSSIIRAGKGNAGNPYTHNVTIEGCDFDASDAYTALKSYQSFDISMFNCTATGLHSVAQITAGSDFEFDTVTSNCVRGISLGTAPNCVVSNCNITTTGTNKYGIRHDVGYSESGLKIANCTINAFIPVCVRKSNNATVTAYNLVFEGSNTLTKQGDSEYHVAIANEEYDANGDVLTAIPNVTITGENAAWDIFK